VFRMPPKARRPLLVLAVTMSAGLFAYLIWRTGPGKLWENVVTLGWGFTWVIALAGVSHLAKTWAWQLTLGEDKHKVSFPLMLGLRLGSGALSPFAFSDLTLPPYRMRTLAAASAPNLPFVRARMNR